MKRLFFLFYLMFYSAAFAGTYKVSSEFRNQDGQLQEVQGLGFVVQTSSAKYFVSPFHVLGGVNKNLPAGAQKVYEDPSNDVVIFELDLSAAGKSLEPLIAYSSECDCLKLNRASLEQNETYYFANKTFALVTKAQMEGSYAQLSLQNKAMRFDNFGETVKKEHLLFDVLTKAGFSGSPVISFDSQLVGFVIRYDRALNKTYVFAAAELYRLLNQLDSKTNQAVQPVVQYQIAQGQLYKSYGNDLYQRRGGDTSDGGDLEGGRSAQSENMASSGLSLGGQDVAYLQILGKRYYPNHSAYSLFADLKVDLKGSAVLDKGEMTDRISYPFAQLKSGSGKILSFAYPEDVRKDLQIIDESFAEIKNDQLKLSMRILKPSICNFEMNIRKNGAVEDHKEFQSVVSIEKCGQKITLDFRSFFFVNMDFIKRSSGDPKDFRPTLYIKWQQNLVPLEFYNSAY